MNFHDELLERFAKYLRSLGIDAVSVQGWEDDSDVVREHNTFGDWHCVGYRYIAFYTDSKKRLRHYEGEGSLSEIILNVCKD